MFNEDKVTIKRIVGSCSPCCVRAEAVFLKTELCCTFLDTNVSLKLTHVTTFFRLQRRMSGIAHKSRTNPLLLKKVYVRARF